MITGKLAENCLHRFPCISGSNSNPRDAKPFLEMPTLSIKRQSMCEGMACGGMMWTGWLIAILAVVVLGLGAAALVKYLRSR